MDYGTEESFIETSEVVNPAALREKLDAKQIGDFEQASQTIDAIRESITLARSLKAEFNLSSNRSVKFFCIATEGKSTVLENHEATLKNLIGMGELIPVKEAPEQMPAIATPLGTFYLDLSGAIDIDKEKERITKEVSKLEGIIKGINGKLNNQGFVANAPAQVVEGARKQLEENQSKLEQLNSMLEKLG